MSLVAFLRSFRRHVSVLIVCWLPLAALCGYTIVETGRLRAETAETATALRSADTLLASLEGVAGAKDPARLAQGLVDALDSPQLVDGLQQADPTISIQLRGAANALLDAIETGKGVPAAVEGFRAAQFVARAARRERMAQLSEALAVAWSHLELVALLALALAAAAVQLERREYRRRSQARSAEDQARTEARLYRDFFQADPSAALVIHAETGLIEHVNRAAAELYGGRVDDLVGERFSRLDPRSEEALLTDLRELSERGVPVLRSHTDLRGVTRSMEVSVSRARNGATRYRLAVRDGAATRDRLRHLGQENERLEATLAGVAAPVVVCDVDGRITWTNAAAAELLSARGGQLKGVSFPDLCVGAGESSAEHQLLQELDYHPWPHRRTLTLETRDGRASKQVWFTQGVRCSRGAVRSLVHTAVPVPQSVTRSPADTSSDWPF